MAAPLAPSNVMAYSGSGQVEVQWSTSAGATSYDVRRAFASDGAFALVSSVAGTNFTDLAVTNGASYFYVVAARSNADVSANSAVMAAVPFAAGHREIFNRLSGLALQNDSFRTAQGVVSNQFFVWNVQPVAGPAFRINYYDGLACVTATNISSQLTVLTFTNGLNQLWTFEVATGAYYVIRNVASGQVVDNFGSSTNAGNPVGQWAMNGGVNQQWRLEQAAPELSGVVFTNSAVLPFYTVRGQVNPHNFPATLVCSFGTDTNYTVAAMTNLVAATNGLVEFSFTFPYANDRVAPVHAVVTASSTGGSASSGDLVVDSISFEARENFAHETTTCVAWGDLNNDGFLDLAVRGSYSAITPAAFMKNPATNSASAFWPTYFGPSAAGGGLGGTLVAGDFDSDNMADFFAAGEPPVLGGSYSSTIYWGHVPPQGIGIPYTPSAIDGELPGAVAVIADFDHTGWQDILLCASGRREMLRNGLTNSYRYVDVFQRLDSIVDLGPVGEGLNQQIGGYNLSGGFMSTNGYMDVFGFNPNNPPTGTFYRNDGDLGFTATGGFQLPVGFANTLYGGASSAWADFNGDGFDDIVICQSGFSVATNMIWLNDGSGIFTNSHWALPQFFDVNIGVGDLFNHGRNDLVMTGSGGGNGGPGSEQALVVRNDGNGVFTPIDYGLFRVVSPAVPGVAMADFDNDGRLDFAIIGGAQALTYPAVEHSLAAYRNLLDLPSNAPPAAPTAPNSTVGAGRVFLAWSGATDDITPANGLTYNVRIGTNTLGTQVVSPLAHVTSGWRMIPARGNVGHSFGTYWNLPPGTYFWSVQAIDGALAGGAWAPEQTFTITNAEPVLVQIATRANQNAVSWSARHADYTLEAATNLLPADPAWATNALAIGSHNGKMEAVITNTPPLQIFRLRK